MATVQGIREKVHLPDLRLDFRKAGKQLGDVEPGNTIKFFVNVQGKTKLETNLQSASLLPHYNTFEARAMRVVISDLPPEFSDEVEVKKSKDVVTTKMEQDDSEGQVEGRVCPERTRTQDRSKAAMELLQKARDTEPGTRRPSGGEGSLAF